MLIMSHISLFDFYLGHQEGEEEGAGHQAHQEGVGEGVGQLHQAHQEGVGQGVELHLMSNLIK